MLLTNEIVYTQENCYLIGIIYQGICDLYNHGVDLSIKCPARTQWGEISCFIKNLDTEFEEPWKEEERKILYLKLRSLLDKFPSVNEVERFLNNNSVPSSNDKLYKFLDGKKQWKAISKKIYYDEL